MERGAAGRVVYRPEPTAVRRNDRPADRQPEAESMVLGSKERIEDLIQSFRWDALAMILDRELHETFGGQGGAESYPSLSWGEAGHGVAGVGHQIQQHLL